MIVSAAFEAGIYSAMNQAAPEAPQASAWHAAPPSPSLPMTLSTTERTSFPMIALSCRKQRQQLLRGLQGRARHYNRAMHDFVPCLQTICLMSDSSQRSYLLLDHSRRVGSGARGKMRSNPNDLWASFFDLSCLSDVPSWTTAMHGPSQRDLCSSTYCALSCRPSFAGPSP